MTFFKRTLLLDVGGTFIKRSDGREIPIDSNGSREEISRALSESVGDFSASAKPGDGIAVAIPGPFDFHSGKFLMKHKFASVYGELFRDLADVPDCVELRFTHDVNAMLRGEMAYGNGKGFNRVALIALGTGLGFSMSIDGEILCNEFGSPKVSIFNLPYKDGVLEDHASKRGFLSTYERLLGKKIPEALTVKDLSVKAAEGDKAALGTYVEVASVISDAIAPILAERSVECLLFGGQISHGFTLMEDTLKSKLSEVKSLKKISTISDFDNATFNGLKSMFDAVV